MTDPDLEQIKQRVEAERRYVQTGHNHLAWQDFALHALADIDALLAQIDELTAKLDVAKEQEGTLNAIVNTQQAQIDELTAPPARAGTYWRSCWCDWVPVWERPKATGIDEYRLQKETLTLVRDVLLARNAKLEKVAEAAYAVADAYLFPPPTAVVAKRHEVLRAALDALGDENA